MKVVFVTIGLFISTIIAAQSLPLDPAVRTGKLSNGFTYFIRKNTEPAGRVQLYLVSKVGSILETEEQRGLAHFMEHMSFNGTKHFPRNKLVDYLQKSGVRFGADLNAVTSFDETIYQLPLPTDDPVVLRNGLQIMRDWAQDASLDNEEIDRERGVVLEEKRLNKGVNARIGDKTLPILLNNSRYANRLPIGTEEVLTTFKRQTILDFYNDWYRPDLQALIVVGDIDVDAIEKQIKDLFSDLKISTSPKARTEYFVPLTGNNQFTVITDPEITSVAVQIFFKHKAEKLVTKEDYHRSLNEALFTQMLAGRFMELSQKPDLPFLQATGGLQGLMAGLNAFTVSVAAKPGKLEQSVQQVWAEVARVQKFGFTEEEFTRTKTSFLAYIESLVKEKGKRSSEDFTREYVQYFLKQESAPGIDAEYAIVSEYFSTLSLSTINALADKYIKDTDRDVIILAPEKDAAAMPDEATVNNWLLKASAELTAYKDTFKKTSLLEVLPVAGKITNERKLAGAGITEWTLSNGMKVILKPTSFKNDDIRFHAFSPGGTSLYSDADFQSVSNAAGLITASGAGDLSVTDLSKLLSSKKLSVMPYIDERFEGIAGTSSVKDLETALQLTYLYFVSPRVDSVIFNNSISQSASMISNRYNDPANVFQDTIAGVLSNYSVRHTGPTLEKLRSFDMSKALRFYKERFANAGDFTCVFTGSFMVDSLRPLAEKYLASLPATGNRETAYGTGTQIPEGKINHEVRKGREDKATVRLVISGNYNYSNDENIQLQALRDILQFRLIERLREKEGGVYSPSSTISYRKYPRNRYVFTITFGCAPANVEKLINATEEEIAKLRKTGPASGDIIKFKTEAMRQHELQVQDNQFWLSYLTDRYQNAEDIMAVEQFAKSLNAVSNASVRATAAKYLGGKSFIRFVLLPE